MTPHELDAYQQCFRRIRNFFVEKKVSVDIEWYYGTRCFATTQYKSPFFWIIYYHGYRNKFTRVKVSHNVMFLTELTAKEAGKKILDFLTRKIRVTKKVKQNLGLQ